MTRSMAASRARARATVTAMPTDVSRPPEWYRDVIIYQLHVRSFCDSNGDGIGDFDGLTSKLDYLVDLGVNAIWTLPFFPSPLRDDGYDIADYRAVNPSYGTMASFKRFLRAAHERDLKVIIELVMNHTSDTHPWFQRARQAPAGSRHRDFYVWSDDPHKYGDTRIIFVDTESSNWTWDPVAGSYYWHRFYSHQPDLNFDSPDVHKAMLSTLDYWFEMGVDGVRLDAIPYLYEREGTNCENLPETHEFLKKVRAHMDANFPDRFVLAEANQWPEDAVEYFGDGDECHMCFHFPLMPRLYLAVQQESRAPIVDILEQTPDLPPKAPVGPVPAQPRRADPGDGHRRGARLHVPALRRRAADADQRRHPPAAHHPARRRPPQDRAAQRTAVLHARARPSSTTATRSAWATTSTSATAMRCARRCSGTPTATPASPERIRSVCRCR